MNLHLWADINFAAAYKAEDLHVDFTVYEVAGTETIDGAEVPTFSDGDCGFTREIEKAEKFARGFVKWDGCSNWEFFTEECMFHACERKTLVAVGEALARCRDLASVVLNRSFD